MSVEVVSVVGTEGIVVSGGFVALGADEVALRAGGVVGRLIDFLLDEGVSLLKAGGVVFNGGIVLTSFEVFPRVKADGIASNGGLVELVSFEVASLLKADGRVMLESPIIANNKQPMKTKNSIRIIPKELMVVGHTD